MTVAVIFEHILVANEICCILLAGDLNLMVNVLACSQSDKGHKVKAPEGSTGEVRLSCLLSALRFLHASCSLSLASQ